MADRQASSASSNDIQEVSVRFITKLDQVVPDTPFAVPVRLTRYGLSGVINHLLEQGKRP